MDKRRTDVAGIVRDLTRLLAARDDVVFAFLHGSFVGGAEFRDIDIAVYLAEKSMPSDRTEYEIALSLRLEKAIGLPVDVKILNHAPLAFRYHASTGTLLVSKDELAREDFLNRTWSEYFDFAYLAKLYREELTRA